MSVLNSGRQRSEGFTLIEVMMSLGVITVGAMAILSMQRATIVANTSAREMTVANEINRGVIERIKLDAINWGTQGCNQSNISPTVDGEENMLREMAIDCSATAWLTPPDGGAYDFRGHPMTLPVDPGSPPIRFCTNHRFEWVVPSTVARVTVRTWWHRIGHGQGNLDQVDYSAFPDCGDPEGVTAEVGAGGLLRHVQAQSLVRWNQPQQR